MKNGQVSISTDIYHDTVDVNVYDETGKRKILIKISLEDFARAMLALPPRKCEYVIITTPKES